MNPTKLIAPDFWVGRCLVLVKSMLDLFVMLVKDPSSKSWRTAKLIWAMKPRFTMVKTKNLVNLYDLVLKVNAAGIDGDIVECGVWNGGSAALMAKACLTERNNDDRLIWLFDSFAGLPAPGVKDGAVERSHYFQGWNRGSVESVKRAFKRLSVPMERVKICPGWFESSLPTAEVNRIAVLHIDADWYSSVICVLRVFYDKVAPGGYIVLDDYGYWEGCNRAIEDFISERDLGVIELKQVTSTGAFFKKPI